MKAFATPFRSHRSVANRLLLRALTGLALAMCTAPVTDAQSTYEPYTFTTFAGTLPGNVDGSGADARFNNPNGVATDGAGTTYVVDTNNNTIRKMTPAGAVTTLAGLAGTFGNDDGTGSAARFFSPRAIAVDNAGNVYVANSAGHTIRKVTADGVVTTIAGLGSTSGNSDGTGSAARFNTPEGVAADSNGNVYVADTRNHTIRKITSAGVVTTIAGVAGSAGSANGTGAAARFNRPEGLAVGLDGYLYVADTSNNAVRRIDAAGAVITIATGFNRPEGVAADNSGNVYVADTQNSVIRKVTQNFTVSTLAGSPGAAGAADGSGGAARFFFPPGLSVDKGSGNVYVADSAGTIRKITPAGAVTTVAGLHSPGSADGARSVARFRDPSCVAVAANNNIYVGDRNNFTVRKITAEGVVSTIAGLAGQRGTANGTGTSARFDTIEGVAVDSAGNVYVADNFVCTIRKITPAGVVTTFAGTTNSCASVDGTGSNARFRFPAGIDTDAADNIYVADTGGHTIRKITPAGVVTTLAGLAGNSGSADGTGSAARFNVPNGLAVDAESNIYVSDAGNQTIRKITPAGVVTTLAGSPSTFGTADGTGSGAQFAFPEGLAVDAAGNVYVADSIHNIRKITPAGVVTTVGGLGSTRGSANGTGSAARFSFPEGVAVDTAGNLYVADTFNNGIRLGVPAATPTPAPSPTPTVTPSPSASPSPSPTPQLAAVITSPLSFDGTVGQQLTYQIIATNNPTAFSASDLPQGLVLDSVLGVITGSPASPGTFELGVAASNAAGSDSRTVTLNVAPAPAGSAPVLTTGSVTARTGESFSYQIVATGITSAARITASGLPAGLAIDEETGFITGTPPQDGSHAVELTLSDGDAVVRGTLQLTFTSDPAFPVITSASSATIVADQAFSYTIVAPSSDGSDPVSYSLIGTLPPGLTFDPNTGTISGTFNPGAAQAKRSRRPSGAAPTRRAAIASATTEVITTVQLFARNSRGTAAATLTFVTPKPGAAVNISTRMQVGRGENVLIAGFIVTGSAPKKVIIRAIGPSLTNAGEPVQGRLDDTVLELFAGDGSPIRANDDWKTDQQEEITDSTIPPGDDRESAIVATLQPGNYTAVLRGKDESTGIGLVEVYDLDTGATAQLAQISTRGFVQQGDDVMIGGFILTGATGTNVLIRAMGPALAAANVAGALEDTTLELIDSNGEVLGANDDWKTDQEQAIRDTTVPPSDDREAAIVRILTPGNYTAIVRGKNNTAGIGLVEVYMLR